MIGEIKQRLLDSIDILVDIMEELGFTEIKVKNKEIRASLPDGDNETSVRVKLTPSLFTNVFTRAEFESNYEINDFISLISFVTNKSFSNTVNYLASKVGIVEGDIVEIETPEIIKVLNRYNYKPNNVDILKYDKSIINIYPNYIVDKWIEEGIPPYIQSLYDVRVDKDRKRWLLPSYDEQGNLITVQGRTYINNYEELKIPKYLYYKLNGDIVLNSNLYGLNISNKHIKSKREVILVEGAKSAMKAYEYGFKNVVAIQGSKITDKQVDKILSLGVDVVLALDKDKKFKDIKGELNKLKPYLNCYYILDKDLLDKKDSPVDKGKEVFEKLYGGKRRYE